MYQHVPVPARPGSLPDHDDWPWLAGAFPGHCGTSLATSAGLCRGHRSKAPAFGHRMVKSPHVLGDPSHLQSSEIDLRPSYDIVKS